MAFSTSLSRARTALFSPKLFRSTHPSPASHARSFMRTTTVSGEPIRRLVLSSHNFALLRLPCLEKGFKYMGRLEEDVWTVTARVDLPGIGKEGLKLWVKGDELHFEGREVEDPDVPSAGVRVYAGVLDVPQRAYNMDRIRAHVKNGVLRIIIPKINWVEWNGSGAMKRLPLGPEEKANLFADSGKGRVPGWYPGWPLDVPRVQFRDWWLVDGSAPPHR